MGGNSETKKKLNKTLEFIIKLLNKNNITDWFVGYGTLLGIIRENSCIHNDNDIDIVIKKDNYDNLKKILEDNEFKIEYGRKINDSRDILKTKATNIYASIDFYMADVDEEGNFYDPWEDVIWSNCYDNNNKLLEKKWKELTLYIPNNYIEKLENRYGLNWKTPQKSRGPTPRKKKI